MISLNMSHVLGDPVTYHPTQESSGIERGASSTFPGTIGEPRRLPAIQCLARSSCVVTVCIRLTTLLACSLPHVACLMCKRFNFFFVKPQKQTSVKHVGCMCVHSQTRSWTSSVGAVLPLGRFSLLSRGDKGQHGGHWSSGAISTVGFPGHQPQAAVPASRALQHRRRALSSFAGR